MTTTTTLKLRLTGLSRGPERPTQGLSRLGGIKRANLAGMVAHRFEREFNTLALSQDCSCGAINASHRSRKATTIEQHLMEQNTKSKEFVQAFREEVKEGQEKLAQELGRLRRGL